ncbi:MAG: protein kinase domain-containing protein, partial [Persicimonas sp.]
MNQDSNDNPILSAPTPASSARLDPIPVGPFDLLEFIGKGAMGQVWLARHREQDVPAAVKVITHRGADTDHYRRHFQQELRAVARLHHPGVVMIFDYLEISREAEEASFGALNYGSPALAMEFCAGGSLVGRLADLSWTEARAILLSLLDSLAHAHARGVIHRDLKPDNILLTDRNDGGVRLTDFGLALLTERLDGENSANRGVCGTPAFMSPEQLHAGWRNIGPWSDLYSLGCLAYQLVCGRPPFDGHSIVEIARKHIHKPVPRLEPRIPVPDRFEAWIHRLLQKSPLDRYRRAGDAAWGLMLMEQPPGDEGPADSPIVSNARASSLVLKPLLDLAGEHRPSHQPISRADRGEAEDDLEDGPREASGDTPEVVPHDIICPPLTRDWRHMVHRRPSVKLIGAGRGLYGLRYIPLIGRETEREFLWERIRQVELTSNPCAALLQGGAGCGKSYLAEWFCDRANENGAVITFKATHNSSPGGAEGLSRMLARRIRTVGLERAQVLERVRSWFEAEGIDDPYMWDALAEILSPATPEDVEAGQRKIQFSRPEQRYAIILRTLRHIAQGRMMALWLDDVQWSTEAVGFMRYCMEQNEAESAPILIIATIRSEALAERPAESKQLVELLELDNVGRCWVEPLSADEHLELVGELLHLEPALARKVADHTDGNPLFAVQL